MTNARETERTGSFTLSLLPWVLGAVMLAVYLLTLNHGATAFGMVQTEHMVRADWRLVLYQPVNYILSFPLRWLPTAMIPLGLNVFNAVCGALTLVCLARSVALLPHDRTHEQRQREPSEHSLLSIPTAWVPPLLAVLVCGLELSFWERATQGSSEILDLLLFAWPILCLLQFRVTQKDSWLNWFALSYGISIAENWAMVSFLPCFLAAVVWIKGLSFFNLRFLLRSLGLWLAGLSLILLLPVAASVSHSPHLALGKGLQLTFTTYRTMLGGVTRHTLLLLCLPSLLPLFIIAIRWPSYFGDTSPLGVFIATAMFHIMHALFLLAGIWIVLGTRISPSQIDPRYSFLPVYYLVALVAGYVAGYFLLIFGARTQRSRHYRPHPAVVWLKRVVVGWVFALLVAAPVLLLHRNLPNILMSGAVQEYAALEEQSLPAGGGVVLSDDPFRLSTLESLLEQHHKHSLWLPLDTHSLEDTNYFAYLVREFPQFKVDTALTNPPAELANPYVLRSFLKNLAKGHELWYLHPSFGDMFEEFYLEPHGLVYRMKPLENGIEVPLPDAALTSENQAFWKSAMERQLPKLVRCIQKPERPARPDLWETLELKLHLKGGADLVVKLAGSYYSRSLDYWGVELQRAGAYAEAGQSFASARDLFPDNAAAKINLEFNQELQAGKTNLALNLPVNVMEERVGARRRWAQILNECGPIDEPNYRYQLAGAFVKEAVPALFNQALQQIKRVEVLVPNQLSVPFMEYQILLFARRYAAADTVADDLLKRSHEDNDRMAVLQVLSFAQQYSNVLARSETMLHASADDPVALFFKGVSLIQLKDYKNAVPALSHLLELETNNAAVRLNRAIAYYSMDDLEKAKPDYRAVVKVATNAFQAYYGLGEIADRQTNKMEALTNYQLYLEYAPTNTPEFKKVKDRLKELQAGEEKH